MTDTQPLFILTCMRSYSSLVSTMLGQHSHLVTLPEIHPFVETKLGWFMDRAQLVRPRTLDGILRTIAEFEFGAQTEITIKQAQDWMRKRKDWTLRKTLIHFAEHQAPKKLIDKSPSTVLTDEALARALKTFPDAYYLHLHRNPVPTTRSIAKITNFKAGTRKPNPAKDPENSWLAANKRIVRASKRIPPGHFMAVRGEDVLSDPEHYLRQICDWLGLETTQADLSAMLQPENSVFARIGPANAPFGGDPNFLRNPLYRKRPIADHGLGEALDWDRADRFLKPETVALSIQLGYANTTTASITPNGDSHHA